MKHSFWFLHCLYMILLYTACTGEKVNDSTDWQIDTTQLKVIHLTDRMTSDYELSQLYISEPDTTLINYHRTANQLELIDYRTGEPLRVIALPTQGPHGIRKVYNFHYARPDSIFLVSDHHLHLMDDTGHFYWSHPINRSDSPLANINFDMYRLRISRDQPIHYTTGELYFAVGRSDVDQFTVPDYYQTPLLGVWQLATNEATLLPIYYPKELQEQFYGFLGDVNFTFLPDRLLYNFKHSPSIYEFDLATEKIATHMIESTLATPLLPYTGAPGNPEDLIRHFNLSTDYKAVQYNSATGHYYRIAALPGHVIGRSKTLGISVLNKDFVPVGEFTLPSYHHYHGSLVTQQGLLVKYSADQAENEVVYRVIAVRIKNDPTFAK